MLTIGMRCSFDAAHRLLNHPGKCRNLHGHTYGVELTLSGATGVDGMILDFYLLKKAVDTVLSAYDHSVILQHADPIAKMLSEIDNAMCIVWMKDEPTVEHMVELIGKQLTSALGKYGAELVSVRVFETPNCWAEFRVDAAV